jgi:hypothetical protein
MFSHSTYIVKVTPGTIKETQFYIFTKIIIKHIIIYIFILNFIFYDNIIYICIHSIYLYFIYHFIYIIFLCFCIFYFPSNKVKCTNKTFSIAYYKINL